MTVVSGAPSAGMRMRFVRPPCRGVDLLTGGSLRGLGGSLGASAAAWGGSGFGAAFLCLDATTNFGLSLRVAPCLPLR